MFQVGALRNPRKHIVDMATIKAECLWFSLKPCCSKPGEEATGLVPDAAECVSIPKGIMSIQTVSQGQRAKTSESSSSSLSDFNLVDPGHVALKQSWLVRQTLQV